MMVKTLPQVHIETFGCQMNESDSELVRSLLKQEGFGFTEDRERADVVLVNTCAIRENAHKKIYLHLSELRAVKKQRPLVVGVLGCMAQNLKSELAEKEPLIDVLAGPDSYRQLPRLLTNALDAQEQGLRQKAFALDLSEYETYENIMPDRNNGVNAWITVMRGCDNFCSFCVVPYTRGRERSRDPESILLEARDASTRGFKQITLLGQNVNSYYHEGWDFARLISAVADQPGIERVRFTSPHPKDFPPALIETIATHPKICKHIHLPLQSGSDRILELMGRNYTGAEYLALADRIRITIPQIVLTTDIICGFCSESEEDFEATTRLVEQAQLDSAYIFKYSERKHTIAARKYADDVSDRVKGMRVAQLLETQRRTTLERNQRYIGKAMQVLVERDATRSPTQAMGKTDGNITVVWEKGTGDFRPGTLITKQIFDASAATLYGE
ncbi:MAG: tRNA (N6-isopentenyl adenosine(37)-C2)-methylthiotransferase MiaB [Nitrospira sp.]|nr:tRNA (N6-isopentenyl adenosine(37)-C2)-methylthiotransferase MiaB [Nitrospira sp.]MDH4250671.1 tRNA (N6-isopentenyl adenosine(37)-C2)-methylthiotransferase MiaB [Nitrospira sp.]MDH4342262.1 tRNA (N6-isopentenyl adenosine(37)-C2)-methylthiotransferase MiaB [Nitrospira sp.]MDH5335201.1 tRNA (N6-isopentenyl adenosine(37)-C2)-methylthiotransferase MiaB [Nitrospira sp.]